MECNFCKKIFSSKSSLNNHLKTAKYCLIIQNKEEINNFNCEYCDRYFTAKKILLIHLKSCKNKKLIKQTKDKELLEKLKKQNKEFQEKLNKKDIELLEQLNKKDIELLEQLNKKDTELLKENKELQKQLKEQYKENFILKENIAELKGKITIYKDDHEFIKEIAKQPKNTNMTTNNTNNNTLNINSTLDLNNLDKIKSLIEDSFNIQYAIDGQKGLARFVVDKLLTDQNGKLSYLCTDPSRQIFKYKDIIGEITKDVEAKRLTNYVIDGGIKKKTTDIATEWYTEDNGIVDQTKFNIMLNSQQNILKLQEDNNTFKKELVSITTR